LKVRVHRGCAEVGGTCVEVESAGSRLVLDVGKPLSAGWGERVPLPEVPGLAAGDDPSLLAVLVSHPHLDHYGLVEQVSPRVPVYAGAAAAAIVEAARYHSRGAPALRADGVLEDEIPLRLGPFTVTPRLVDHSAYDSYALVVDAGGRRLMYTGDFRGHGRKARLFDGMIDNPPTGVDTLLMEGTHIPAAEGDSSQTMASGRPGRVALTEREVELAMAQTFRRTAGLPVVVSSAQNVDRLVTVYRAARRADRILLVDLYTADVAQATGRVTIPQPGFPDLGVFVPLRQRVRVKESGEFHRTRSVAGLRVYPEQLVADPARYVVLGGSAAVPELIRAGALSGGVMVWSLWEGYLAEPSGQRLLARLAAGDVPWVHHHTSGHAPVSDLKRFVEAVNPARLVPIHTEGAEQFGRHFTGVCPRQDGAWWTV
jgi:ribonuclease J